MIEVRDADALIASHMPQTGVERIALSDAAGRILREDVTAERDLPPYDRATMDGIALRVGAGASLSVLGRQLAGMPPSVLPDGASCFEIATGAVLPEGADAVVPIERVRRDRALAQVEAGYVPAVGQFIHRRGADCAAGAVLLRAGARLDGPSLAILAGNGRAEVSVACVPCIGIVSTGDELVEVDAPVRDWQIRASNDHAIAGALSARGFRDHLRTRAPDDEDATRRVLGDLLERCCVVVLSGGVSMGTHDHVPRALEALGVTRVFHKVAQRPGRPMWFGVSRAGRAVFALPGNPVSALVCCVRYVVPALLRAQGASDVGPVPVALEAEAACLPDLVKFLPVLVRSDCTGRRIALPQPVSTSGDFNRLGGTHGVVELPRGERVAAGEVVDFHGW